MVRYPVGGVVWTRILSGWYGGYAHGDEWRLSTNIVELTEEKDEIVARTESGTVYSLHKKAWGTTGLSQSVLDRLHREAKEIGAVVEILPSPTGKTLGKPKLS